MEATWTRYLRNPAPGFRIKSERTVCSGSLPRIGVREVTFFERWQVGRSAAFRAMMDEGGVSIPNDASLAAVRAGVVRAGLNRAELPVLR